MALKEKLAQVDTALLLLREKVLTSSRRAALLARFLVKEPGVWEAAPPISFRGKAWSICDAAEQTVIAYNLVAGRFLEVRDHVHLPDPPPGFYDTAPVEISSNELVQAGPICPVCAASRNKEEPEPTVPKAKTLLSGSAKQTQV